MPFDSNGVFQRVWRFATQFSPTDPIRRQDMDTALDDIKGGLDALSTSISNNNGGSGAGGLTEAQVQALIDTSVDAAAIPFGEFNVNSNTQLGTGAEGKIVKINATSNNVTVILPDSTSMLGRAPVSFVRLDTSSNTVTIQGNGTEHISGQQSRTLDNEIQSMTLQADGSGWYITGQKPAHNAYTQGLLALTGSGQWRTELGLGSAATRTARTSVDDVSPSGTALVVESAIVNWVNAQLAAQSSTAKTSIDAALPSATAVVSESAIVNYVQAALLALQTTIESKIIGLNGQFWQDRTANRGFDVAYQNTNTYPIVVHADAANNADMEVSSNGVVWYPVVEDLTYAAQIMISPGHYYRFTNGTILTQVSEYR